MTTHTNNTAQLCLRHNPASHTTRPHYPAPPSAQLYPECAALASASVAAGAGDAAGLGCATSGHPHRMANYRVIDPHGTVVATKDISSSEDAHAWFKDSRADNEELGWRLEVEHDGDWAFFSDSEGTKD